MTAPLGGLAPALTAIPVGLAFGAALERAGLGSARTIADQLTARDFTVVKVMFSAIVTAMLGIFWADRLGWLDLSRVALPPTDLLPQAAGAAIFGAGFAVASLCPGTACVSAATGTRDGWMTVLGLFLGTTVTAVAYPGLGSLAVHAPAESARLPGSLGLSAGAVVAGMTLLGVVTIGAASRMERGGVSGRAGPVPLLAAAAIALGGLAALAGDRYALEPLSRIAAEIAHEDDHVDVLDLAEWIRDHRPGLRVIDVREGLQPEDYRIPGAEVVPLEEIASLPVQAGQTVVLYSDGGTHAAQAWVLLRARGLDHVYVVRDGLAAWEDDVLSPRPPAPGDSVALARFRRARALANYYGGLPSLGRPETSAPPTRRDRAAPRHRRRNTC